MKFDEFIPMFSLLEAAFGDQPEAKALLYFDTFKPYAFDAVKVAIATIIQTGDRFPLPKDILAHMPGATPQLSPGKKQHIEPWMLECEKQAQAQLAAREREEADLTMEQRVELWISRTARRPLNPANG